LEGSLISFSPALVCRESKYEQSSSLTSGRCQRQNRSSQTLDACLVYFFSFLPVSTGIRFFKNCSMFFLYLVWRVEHRLVVMRVMNSREYEK
jgi:hypothetical protein